MRRFSLKEVTSEIASFSKIEKIYMISAIDNHEHCSLRCYEENMIQQLFISLLESIVHEMDRKVLLIMDNLKVHHGIIVQEWLYSHKDDLELFFIS